VISLGTTWYQIKTYTYGFSCSKLHSRLHSVILSALWSSCSDNANQG